jgi:hypothetical protein
MVASSFVCVVILPLYFQLMFVTSSRTVGMLRSACSSPFGTYHGALTLARSTLFWNLCNISILDVNEHFIQFSFTFFQPRNIIESIFYLGCAHCEPGALSPGVERLKCETNRCMESNVEVRNA